MKSARKNIAESVRARLLNLSKQRGDEFQLTLTNYVIERFLYRLGRSQFRDRFVLKGAVLFRVWMGQSHRPTKDLDLLGNGSSGLSEVAEAIRKVCLVEADDGVVFDLDAIQAERIREDAEYEGVRIRFGAELAAAKIPLQIDVGFGDAITPEPSIDSRPVHARHGPSPSPRVSPRDRGRRETACDGDPRHIQHADEGLL
jgi:hypothetical protein